MLLRLILLVSFHLIFKMWLLENLKLHMWLAFVALIIFNKVVLV